MKQQARKIGKHQRNAKDILDNRIIGQAWASILTVWNSVHTQVARPVRDPLKEALHERTK